MRIGILLVLCLMTFDSSADRKDFVALPDKVPDSPDNPRTAEKIELGRQLFFDPRLSGNNQMSCATCHLPEKALADGLPLGRGHDDTPLSRNTPSLLNVGLFRSFFWDGRAASLEEQALAPIVAADEMNQNLEELEAELNAVPGYVRQFKEVFGGEVTRETIAKALAAFERTLVTGPSPLDRYLAGEEDALSSEAKAGMELFVGSAGCVRCHNGPLLSDGEFYRLGIDATDLGRGLITGKKEDEGKFRTPSLRNVAQTAPYMHDGSIATLFEVVEYYYRGVPSESNGLPVDVTALSGQSYSEIASLVAFLEALSGKVPEVTKPPLPN